MHLIILITTQIYIYVLTDYKGEEGDRTKVHNLKETIATNIISIVLINRAAFWLLDYYFLLFF